jgi:hypothetical protein
MYPKGNSQKPHRVTKEKKKGISGSSSVVVRWPGMLGTKEAGVQSSTPQNKYIKKEGKLYNGRQYT